MDISIFIFPNEILMKILSYSNFEELSKLRQVCQTFDAICQTKLNNGFSLANSIHSKLQKEYKSKLPRRESERRNHHLARHVEIISAIETRLSLLGLTYTKFIDSNLCCFIPGKVLDELFRILAEIPKMDVAPRSLDFLKEFRDISSMAIEHFDERIRGSMTNVYCSLNSNIYQVLGSSTTDSLSSLFSDISDKHKVNRLNTIRKYRNLSSVRKDLCICQNNLQNTLKKLCSEKRKRQYMEKCFERKLTGIFRFFEDKLAFQEAKRKSCLKLTLRAISKERHHRTDCEKRLTDLELKFNDLQTKSKNKIGMDLRENNIKVISGTKKIVGNNIKHVTKINTNEHLTAQDINKVNKDFNNAKIGIKTKWHYKKKLAKQSIVKLDFNKHTFHTNKLIKAIKESDQMHTKIELNNNFLDPINLANDQLNNGIDFPEQLYCAMGLIESKNCKHLEDKIVKNDYNISFNEINNKITQSNKILSENLILMKKTSCINNNNNNINKIKFENNYKEADDNKSINNLTDETIHSSPNNKMLNKINIEMNKAGNSINTYISNQNKNSQNIKANKKLRCEKILNKKSIEEKNNLMISFPKKNNDDNLIEPNIHILRKRSYAYTSFSNVENKSNYGIVKRKKNSDNTDLI